jgi:hypothetical protein
MTPARPAGYVASGVCAPAHGLYLFIVDAIIAAHGAAVTAYARTGGSLFVEVAFPEVPDEPSAAPQAICCPSAFQTHYRCSPLDTHLALMHPSFTSNLVKRNYG